MTDDDLQAVRLIAEDADSSRETKILAKALADAMHEIALLRLQMDAVNLWASRIYLSVGAVLKMPQELPPK